ncbi:hypothetical protein FACS1894202_02410 [Clostridia bacterium]|nr:hypothetical protein FACS1894202_02410 [Clostridia bacterium]
MAEVRKTVFFVDDNATNLAVGKNALADDYSVFTLPSAQKLLDILEKKLPDLILLDVEMPDMDGYEVLRILRGNPRCADIPVIFVTGTEDERVDEGLELGAYDFIFKPFSPGLLVKRIANYIELAELRGRRTLR